jgi:hypothetical protein
MFFKEPTEVSELGLSWADWLVDVHGAPLTISTSVWTGPAGITIVGSEIDDPLTIVAVNGGSWDELYELTNTITANNGETENRSILIRIQRSAPYCSPSEVREIATQITPTSKPVAWTNDVLSKLIERASRLFDMECGVEPGFFQASGNPSGSERILYGDGTNFLKLPPYVQGTLNTTLGYPSGYTELEFAERGGYLVRTESGILNVQNGGWYEGVPIGVSAKWGFAETPADVRHAIIKLVIHICRTVDPTQLKLLVLEGQPLFQDRMPKDVIDLAKKYRWREAVLV